MVGGRLYIERYGMVLWLDEIVYTAVCNDIVAGKGKGKVLVLDLYLQSIKFQNLMQVNMNVNNILVLTIHFKFLTFTF